MKSRVNQKRIRIINETELSNGPVVYWMNRDQRIRDNWVFARVFTYVVTGPFAGDPEIITAT